MRDEFTRATKSAAWARCDGLCEECGNPIRSGHGPEYDHIVEAWLGGSADLENCAVLCAHCHSKKTATQSIPRIAKTKRVLAKRIKADRPKRPMPGTKASGLRKHMDGSVSKR